MNMRNREYTELLKRPFNEQKFIEFITDLLNLDFTDINHNISERTNIPNQYKDNISNYKYIAKYNDGLNDIGIFSIKLNDKTTTKARSMQRNFIAKLLSTYNLDASIVSFHSDKETSWRLSFVKKELNFDEKGFKEVLTPAKRYSYLVGEHEAVHTAQKYLLKLLQIDSRKITLDDIEDVFDVEKVTKSFFEEYKEKYLSLKKYLDKNEDFITESNNYDFTSVEFAKKLMGQIVFLYFLQKKGWLGVQLIPNQLSLEEYNYLLKTNDSVSNNLITYFYEFKENAYIINKNKLRLSESLDITNLSNIFVNTKYDKPWGTGQKDFIRSIYIQSQKEHKNFFDFYLEQFFYKGLNEKRDNQYFPLFNCKIPFLNGGLFEPLNNYRWSSSRFSIPNEMFSNDKKTGILDFLDLYNFTINEEEPLEKEIAVDPEMLGKIFENLLEVDERKSKGTFYTPREIVYYMCQESLANHLVNKVDIDYNEIIRFIKYGDLISQIDWENSLDEKEIHELGDTIYNNIIEIDKALMNVKVADPAVGSGAFPLGMLTEIVKLRNNLTTYMLIQKELGLIDLDAIINTEQGKRDIFDMKLQTIENCIYAVDIETSAIDITKLRLWLSLIVDYPNDEEPKPLPNLDCKIMQGNSLLDEFENIPLFDSKMLDNHLKKYKRNTSENNNIKTINIQFSFLDTENNIEQQMKQFIKYQREYFIASDSRKKKELKSKMEEIQFGMIEETFKKEPEKLKKFREEAKKRKKSWFIWKLEFYDVFKENGGFDIVIGNPPYVGEKGNKDIFEPITKSTFGQKYHQGKMDLFYYFFHKAIEIGNKNAEIIFITTNYYITATGADKLRKSFKDDVKIRKLINFNEFKIFPSALGQHNMITELTKNKTLKETKTIVVNLKGYLDDQNIKYILDDEKINNDVKKYTLRCDEIFDGKENYIRLEKNEATPILKKIECNKKLEDYCFIHQGLKSNSDKVTESHINKYKNLIGVTKGEGIFVINKKELSEKSFVEEEMRFVKPLFKNSDINKYFTKVNNDEYILYITKEDYVKSTDTNITKHLTKYIDILQNRAEVEQNGNIKLFALTRPREKFMYETKKIVAPYKSRGNIFGYNDIDWYASGDVYFINNKPTSELDLKYILGILNSKLYYVWFYFKGKRKGNLFELYQKPLSETPIIYNGKTKLYNKIINCVNLIYKESNKIDIYQKYIDECVYKICNLSNDEIKYIEELYEQNSKDIDE